MSDRLTPLSAGLGVRVEALEARVKATLALSDKVRAALDAPEKSHVVSASYRDATLIVSTDSAAWCAQIRLQEARLRQRLEQQGEKPFTILKVRVSQPG
ncbi:MAG: DUF721 domain-containing protein [Candidatus Obscuribacterales bacterium]|nr:DUF721 domain-containing protein [Steroidobacteraceae bacterium]